MRKIEETRIRPELPELIKELIQERINKRIPMLELAIRIGTNKSTLEAWESGKHDVRLKNLIRWAEALDLKLWWWKGRGAGE